MKKLSWETHCYRFDRMVSHPDTFLLRFIMKTMGESKPTKLTFCFKFIRVSGWACGFKPELYPSNSPAWGNPRKKTTDQKKQCTLKISKSPYEHCKKAQYKLSDSSLMFIAESFYLKKTDIFSYGSIEIKLFCMAPELLKDSFQLILVLFDKWGAGIFLISTLMQLIQKTSRSSLTMLSFTLMIKRVRERMHG